MKNNILLLTYHSKSSSPDYLDLLTYTRPHFEKYAQLNNYDYKHDIVITPSPGIDRESVVQKICLQKLDVINQHLQSDYEYIIYSDIDIFIRDTTYNIFENYSLHKDITFSKDHNGLCAGFMIVKNTKFNSCLLLFH